MIIFNSHVLFMRIIVAAPWFLIHLPFKAHQALPVTDKPDDSEELGLGPLSSLRRLEEKTLSDISESTASRHKQDNSPRRAHGADR